MQESREPPEQHPSSDGPVDVVARHRRLVRRTALVSFLTLLSRVVGFVRESMAAFMFGDRSVVSDAFVTAWRVPNLFRNLMGEGAISTSLQSALTRVDAQQGEEAGRQLFLAFARVVWWVLAGLCALVMFGVYSMPDTLPILGWHWLGAEPGPVRELVVHMLPYVILVCLSALAGGALNVRGHFLSPSLAPVVMNCLWVGALVLVAGKFGWSRVEGSSDAGEFERQMGMARALATLVLITGTSLILVQLPALVSNGLLFRPRNAIAGQRTRASEVWVILKSSAPLALGAAVYQVNTMIDGLMAESLLPSGGPTALYYASRLQQLPLSLVSIAATSAVFPALAAFGHTRDFTRLKRLHDDTHGAIAFVAVPATLGLFVLAGPVCAVCFQHGAFGPEGVERTAAALRWLTVAVLPAGAAGLVARTYYALGDFKTPVRIAIAMMCANSLLNVAFVAGLGMDADGLAVSTAITTWGNLALLLPGLRRRFALPPAQAGTGRHLLLVGLCAVISAGAALGVHSWLATGPESVLALTLSIVAALLAYGVCAQVLGLREWRHLMSRLGRG